MVTGGAGSIGAATVQHLADRGAAVAVCDIDLDHATAVAESLQSNGSRTLPVALDVSDEANWADVVARIGKELGQIDLLHSNAALVSDEGIALDTTLAELTVSYWDKVMSINLRGAMLGCRSVIPSMQAAGRGSIVITSSITALLAKPDKLAYATSKAALIAFARGVAAAHGAENIRCNIVAPGPVDSRATRNIDPELRRLLNSTSMIPRFSSPDDIARAVGFLLSDDAAMITGHVLVVDGGITASYPNPVARG